MTIRTMDRAECLALLSRSRLARLGCCSDNQPYILPVYLACDGTSGCLYGFTTPGQKLEWMRANPRVCVEVDEVTANDRWMTVIVTGHFKELPEANASKDAVLSAPERPRNVHGTMPATSAESQAILQKDERERAWQLLQSHAEWWEPAFSVWADRKNRDPSSSYIPVYYRIDIDHVTGHEATRNAHDAALKP